MDTPLFEIENLLQEYEARTELSSPEYEEVPFAKDRIEIYPLTCLSLGRMIMLVWLEGIDYVAFRAPFEGWEAVVEQLHENRKLKMM